ncbi:class I SAM-dependent methyltransferase [Sphaerimonospora thailandensis]|uniref:Methyltransferase n=1 Tax=Sphaerimonospora thailandensis TaxID=795644 RepID=A0A8J3R257_9ACTN|nr:class I SAM-dependent methyltransferase [Sphaerimonospora thailandensis]GIH67781.1 methyltransferase [Sphaerimonospora thailandensis]
MQDADMQDADMQDADMQDADMQDMVRWVENCRVCGGNDWLDVISFGSTPLANGFLDPAAVPEDEPAYPLEVGVCRDCRLMSIRHTIDPEALFSHYVYVSSDSDLMAGHMRHIADLCVRRAGLDAGDLVVEMGSNIGTQLALFQEGGQRVVGVDPAKNLVQVANDQGIPSIAAFFGAAEGARVARDFGQAKLVLGRQCFAHIENVHNVLDGVEAVLAPDGLLVIEVPYLVNLIEENQFDTIYHEHASYFSITTLSRLFAAHGLHIVDAERVAVHGGSIVVMASRVTAGRRPMPVVAELVALEQERGLTDDSAYLEFAARTRRVLAGVGDLVRDLAARGKRVAGYGAPSKGTALLQFCGLGPREIEFCSDTTPLKHGKLLPGTHIPVRSPEQARSNPPDYYLLLAWNYAEEIIRKERRFLEDGGRFIVPIPEPRIVSAESVLESFLESV